MKRKFFVLIATLFAILPCFAAYNSWGIPDSAEIRTKLSEIWFEAPLETVRTNSPKIYSNSAGQKFLVSLEETDTVYNIVVSSSTVASYKYVSQTNSEIIEQETYPGNCKGSWLLVKSKADNKPLFIRYYCTSNSEVYVQFSPYGKTSVADMVIFGNYAARGVSTGVPFSKFYSASFDDVYKLTQKSLPWKYIDVKDNLYDNIHSMAKVINSNCPRILYTNDAMYNEDNELISISNGESIYDSESAKDTKRLFLSSAGFVKWIADGIVYPITGSQLKRSPLITETVKVKSTSLQGIMSQKNALNFSLDWIRNISSAIISVYTGKQYTYKNSGVDVTINPFAATETPDGIKKQVTFIEDTGYTVSSLKSLLYVLAATESGSFYFGAIRETDRSVTPEIKVFNDCVAFFPYFDDKGTFGCYVFMNGKPTTLDDFLLYYSKDFVYLTRVRSTDRFYPN